MSPYITYGIKNKLRAALLPFMVILFIIQVTGEKAGVIAEEIIEWLDEKYPVTKG